MPAIQERFDHAVKVIQSLPKDGPFKPSNEDKLKFYSFFKQATIGKVNTQRPGMLDFVGKAKWDAWNALGEMSSEEAMEQYVAVYEEMEQKIRELGLIPQ